MTPADISRINELLEHSIDEWMSGDYRAALHVFLGVTKKEYKEWTKDRTNIPLSWRHR